jgi:hypothetical protein
LDDADSDAELQHLATQAIRECSESELGSWGWSRRREEMEKESGDGEGQ